MIFDKNRDFSEKTSIINFMGYKPRIDYDTQIKPLFMAGMELPDIAKNSNCSYHALRKYARLHGWMDERKNAKNLVNETELRKVAQHQKTPLTCVSGAQVAANVLASRKNMYLDKVSAVINRSADVLSKQDLDDLEDVKRAFKAFEPVNEVAKSVYGLGKDVNAVGFTVKIYDLDDIPEADAEVVQSQ